MTPKRRAQEASDRELLERIAAYERRGRGAWPYAAACRAELVRRFGTSERTEVLAQLEGGARG